MSKTHIIFICLCVFACAGPKSVRQPESTAAVESDAASPAEPRRTDIAVVATADITELAAEVATEKEVATELEDEVVKKASKKKSAAPPPAGDAAELDEGAPGVDTASHIARGRRALERGDPDRAIAAARLALRADSDAVEAISLLAAAYTEKRFYDRARSILEAATRRAPGSASAELWMQLGLVREHGDLAGARAAYQRATELKPNYARAWNNLGAVHIERGDHAAAASALETALSLDGDSLAALTNLGTACRRRAAAATGAARDELLRKAESHYLAVIRQRADHAPAHLDLGLLYLDAEPFPGMDDVARLQAAVQHLRQFTRLGWNDARFAAAGSEYLDEALRALQAATERTQRDKRRSKKR